MKKILCLLFCFFYIQTANSQEIIGLGNFKIGMTVEEFLEVPHLKSKDLSEKNSSKFIPEHSDLWKKTANSDVESYDRIYSQELTNFEFLLPIGIINVLGTDLYWTEVTFYKNLLVSINIKDADSSFEKILSSKYGKPTYEKKTKQIICQNGYGAKTSHSDGTNYYVWGNGKKVIAQLAFTYYSCGKTGITYEVKNTAVMNTVLQLEARLKKDAEIKETLTKAKESKL